MECCVKFIKSCFCCSSCPCFRSSIITRCCYLLIFSVPFFTSIFLLSSTGKPYVQYFNYYYCQDGKYSDCKSFPEYLAVYRFCFSFYIFFLLIFAITIGVQNARNGRAFIQNGCWIFKILIILCCLFALFHIPPGMADYVLMIIGLIASTIFVTIGLILLMALSHSSVKWLVKLWFNGSLCAIIILVTFFIICINTTISMTIFLLLYYQKCNSNLHFIILNIFLSYFLSFISVFAARPNQYAGVVQGGVMGTYVMLLTWSVVINNPDEKCEIPEGSIAFKVCDIIWITLTCIAVLYANVHTFKEPKEDMDATVVVEKRGKGICGINGKIKIVEIIPSSTESNEVDEQKPIYVTIDKNEDEYRFLKYNWSVNHLLYANGLLYLMLLLTDWYVPDYPDRKRIYWNSTAMWFKAASSWLCFIVYAVLLFHPTALNFFKMLLYVP